MDQLIRDSDSDPTYMRTFLIVAKLYIHHDGMHAKIIIAFAAQIIINGRGIRWLRLTSSKKILALPVILLSILRT